MGHRNTTRSSIAINQDVTTTDIVDKKNNVDAMPMRLRICPPYGIILETLY